MKSTQVWNQGIARASILGSRSRTHNPTLAASFLLGKARVRRAGALLRRVGRKRAHRGNPLPAVAGLLGGGLPSIGRRVDPKKHGQRAAAVERIALKASGGDQRATESLERIANGLEWPGQWADLRQLAQQHLGLVAEKQEKAAAARRESAEAASAREGRFLEAGTTVGSALFGALGRGAGRRLPRRRTKKRRRTSYY